MRSTDGLPRTRLTRRWIVAGVLILACGVVAVGVSRLPRGLNLRDFQRIRLGMTDEEVTTLLGRKPDASVVMLGRITGPEFFTPDGAGNRYLYREWNDPKISIVTLSDPDSSRVLCRYSRQGYLSRLTQWRLW